MSARQPLVANDLIPIMDSKVRFTIFVKPYNCLLAFFVKDECRPTGVFLYGLGSMAWCLPLKRDRNGTKRIERIGEDDRTADILFTVQNTAVGIILLLLIESLVETTHSFYPYHVSIPIKSTQSTKITVRGTEATISNQQFI